jgi:hypothetical protein
VDTNSSSIRSVHNVHRQSELRARHVCDQAAKRGGMASSFQVWWMILGIMTGVGGGPMLTARQAKLS